MAWPVIGRAFSPSAFKAYVDSLSWGPEFRPQFLTLHNTAAPSLAQRPDGLTFKHIKSLEAYYRDQRNWNGGPHLFIDDKQIWVFNDLTKIGVHSPSWNRVALGIEMLGDYECESFTEGRGLKVRANTVAAMAALNSKLGFSAGAFRFHIEDKKSNHACPGKLARAERAALVAEIEASMAAMAGRAVVADEPLDAAPAEAPSTIVAATGKPFYDPEPSASKAPVIKTAYQSKSIWALVIAGIQLAIANFTTWLHSGWDFVVWSLGVLPEIADEVKTAVGSSKELFQLIGIDWQTISISIALGILAVVAIRHLNDKRKLPA